MDAILRKVGLFTRRPCLHYLAFGLGKQRWDFPLLYFRLSFLYWCYASSYILLFLILLSGRLRIQGATKNIPGIAWYRFLAFLTRRSYICQEFMSFSYNFLYRRARRGGEAEGGQSQRRQQPWQMAVSGRFPILYTRTIMMLVEKCCPT